MRIFVFALVSLLFLENSQSYSQNTLANVKGLELYMFHEIFGEEGRRLVMAFSESQEYDKEYELVITYEIIRSKIIISFLNKDEKVNEHNIYSPGLHRPRGSIYIPDSLLIKDKYKLILKTADFDVISELIVTKDSREIEIPDNKNFTCYPNIVYPIPKDLLLGQIRFNGTMDYKKIEDFFEEFEKLGLTIISLPNYPYKYLTVDESGRPICRSASRHGKKFKLLYKMDSNFRDVANLMEEWYWAYQECISFRLYSSNGDQAILSDDGIYKHFTDE